MDFPPHPRYVVVGIAAGIGGGLIGTAVVVGGLDGTGGMVGALELPNPSSPAIDRSAEQEKLALPFDAKTKGEIDVCLQLQKLLVLALCI